jgi:multiple antibiotic resistance protein
MIMAKPSAIFDTGGRNPAVIPLAIPKTAGPGAIATVIALNQVPTSQALLANTFAIVVVTVLAMLAMLGSGLILKVLGDVGLNIVRRIFGLLLLAIAVTAIMNSLLAYFPGLNA